MPVPASQMFAVARYVLGQKLRGRKRFPLVLMLEPLYRCNLQCAGCGKIQYPSHILRRQLSVEDCLRAADECPAPVVSIPGGEPLLHPRIDAIVEGLVARKRWVYLCTNALLLGEKLDLFRPTPYLSFSVHLDGLEEDHDRAVCRPGTHATAVAAIRKAVERGFRVTTNTTLFEGADPDRVAAFFDQVMALGVEGMMISPGYAYEKAPDRAHFLARERTRELFRKIFSRGIRRWRFNQSPLFLEFLAGARDYGCTPWGNPTYSVFGWQRPCYLLQDGYEPSFESLLEKTRWQDYGPESGNPHCRDCMVHSGFEASAVEEAFSSWRGLAAMARAFLFGPRLVGKEGPPGRRTPLARSAPASQKAAAPGRGWSAPASAEALRAAFDYRGEVVLTLDDGAAVEGFLANLDEEAAVLWSRGSGAGRPIPRARIRHVALTGRDPAAPAASPTRA